MRRVLGAMTVLFVIGATVGVSTAAAAEETADDAPLTIAETLSAAASAGADSPQDLSEAAGTPAGGPGSLTFDAEGRVVATVQFAAAPDAAQLGAVRAVARIDQELTFLHALTVSVEAGALTDLAAVDGVVSVTPVLRPTVGSASRIVRAAPPAPEPYDGCRAFAPDAAEPLRADLAAENFGVDGTGVTIGVISDSYESGAPAATTAAQDVALGVLPGEGNPCGYETPVEVLLDSAQGADEGRAMAQLVHGIAPGARILFHTAMGGSAAMANAVLSLAQAGADIIVDDISYSDEPHFQRGLISAAITVVRDAGVAYYTSAGNANVIGAEGTQSEGKPISGWQTAQYRPTACPGWVEAPETFTTYDCLDFDPNGGGDATDTMSLGEPSLLQFNLHWSEPVFGVTTTLLPQLYVQDGSDMVAVGTSSLMSGTLPIGVVSVGEGDEIDGEFSLVVVRDTSDGTEGTPAVWAAPFGNGVPLRWAEYDESAGDDLVGLISNGHSADGSGVGIAAADWRTPLTPETFSSPGEGIIHFEPVSLTEPVPAPAYPTPRVVPGPQLASVDGNRTSFFYPPAVAGEYFFYGTSAAAPNAAAVHALALSYAPSTAQQTIVDAAAATTRAMTNPLAAYLTDEQYFGHGLIDADALLGQLPVGAVTGLSATALSDASVAAAWHPLAGADRYRVELLRGAEVLDTDELDADTTATSWAGLTAETGYTVRVTAIGRIAQTGPAVTASATTPRPAPPAVPPATPTTDELGSDPAPGLSLSTSAAAPGDEVTVSGLPPHAWVYGWLFSDPFALGWAWTGADGAAAFTIPADVPAGSHRLAIRAADGTFLGWLPLQVSVPASSPVTASLARAGLGVDLAPAAWGALGALAAGAVLLGGGRRRTARR